VNIHTSEWEHSWGTSTRTKINKQTKQKNASECGECFARFRNGKANSGLRHSFTTQIQNALRITSTPNIRFSVFFFLWLYNDLSSSKTCCILPATIISHNLRCLHSNVSHFRCRCKLIMLRKIPHIQKLKAANTVNVTANGIYNYNSRRHNLCNS
jgi:hypothetical protein